MASHNLTTTVHINILFINKIIFLFISRIFIYYLSTCVRRPFKLLSRESKQEFASKRKHVHTWKRAISVGDAKLLWLWHIKRQCDSYAVQNIVQEKPVWTIGVALALFGEQAQLCDPCVWRCLSAIRSCFGVVSWLLRKHVHTRDQRVVETVDLSWRTSFEVGADCRICGKGDGHCFLVCSRCIAKWISMVQQFKFFLYRRSTCWTALIHMYILSNRKSSGEVFHLQFQRISKIYGKLILAGKPQTDTIISKHSHQLQSNLWELRWK